MVLFSAALACRRVQVLRRSDVTNLKVKLQNAHTLVVTGGVFHSGLQISGVAQRQERHRRVIRIYLSPVEPGGKSNFRVLVPLSEATEEVSIGDSNWETVATVFGYPLGIPWRTATGDDVIWRRGHHP